MTEDEAKQKWCPFARVTVVGKGDSELVGNRFEHVEAEQGDFRIPDASHCIGSKCMAWREVTRLIDAGIDKPAPQEVTLYGYCGLAGKPQ